MASVALAGNRAVGDVEAHRRHRVTLRVGIAFALALVLVAPSLFIVAEGHHDCSGGPCPICKVVAGAVQLSQQGASTPDPACSTDLAAPSAPIVEAAFPILVSSKTLVSLKVRMNE